MLTVSHVASRVPRGVPVLVAARVTCWLVLSTRFYAELSSSLPFSFFGAVGLLHPLLTLRTAVCKVSHACELGS